MAKGDIIYDEQGKFVGIEGGIGDPNVQGTSFLGQGGLVEGALDPGANERRESKKIARDMYEKGMDLYDSVPESGGQVNPYTGEIMGRGESYIDEETLQGMVAPRNRGKVDPWDTNLGQWVDPETGQLKDGAPDEVRTLFENNATSYDPTTNEYYDFTKPEMGDPLEFAKEGETVLQGDSNMAGVEADPLAVDRQREAMGQMYDIANQGGLTAIDRARMEEARRDQNQWVRGQREANQARMEARGMSGSGTQLVDDMIAAQQGAQRISQADLSTEAMAQQRAMDAIYGYGDMASGVRKQSFNEGARRAEAQDIIDRFNTSGERGVRERDTARENKGIAGTWDRKNEVYDRRVGLENEEERRRGNMPGRMFDRKGRALEIASGQSRGLRDEYEKEAKGDEKLRDNVVGGGTEFIKGYL